MAYSGSQTLDFLYKVLDPDKKWLTKEENGFTYAYSKFAYQVVIEKEKHPVDKNQFAWFFTVTAPMLKGLENTRENRKILNDELFAKTSVCIPVYDPQKKTLSLVVRVGIHQSVEAWLSPFLSCMMIVQMKEVISLASRLASLTGSDESWYIHPEHGMREDVDEIVKVYNDLVLPCGSLPCACEPSEIRDVENKGLHKAPFVLTTSGENGITTELPQGEETSLLEIKTNIAHWMHGNGLSINHSFFPAKDEDECITIAISHNQQLAQAIFSYGIGSFLYKDGFYSYTLFIPNFLYQQGMLLNLIIASCAKAIGVIRYLKLPLWDKDSVTKCLNHKKELLAKKRPRRGAKVISGLSRMKG